VVNKDDFLRAMGPKISRTVEKQGRLYFEVADKNLTEVAVYLFRTMGCRLSTATAMETYHGLEVLYHFSHDVTGWYYCPRVVIPDKVHPRVTSITPVIRGAEWIEREMAEFWGITFEGHPRPERLLSKDHPQRLDKPFRFRRMS
jgi:NADH-quinone oxidoreductase subunit C